MNKDQLEGKAEQLSAGIKKAWAKLTDNDVLLYKAEKEKFYGRIKELSGDTREIAEKKMKEIEKSCGFHSDKAA